MSRSRKKQKVGTKSGFNSRLISHATNATIVPDEFAPDGKTFHEIPVIKKQQKGVVYFSGEMSIAQLAALTDVANYDSTKEDEQGYQRNNTEKRGSDFGHFISDDENTCLGEIMLNDRDNKAEFVPLKELMADAPSRKLSTVCGVLRIPGNAKFYAYDGQTRRFGYISLLHYELAMAKQGECFDFQHMKIPFCLEQATYIEELDRFLTHNGRQAKVPNSHRAMIVFNANIDYEVIKNQTADDRAYSISAGVVRKLNDDYTSPWYHMIKMPDTPTKEGQKLIANMESFHTGMKGMLKWMNQQYWSPEISLSDKREDMLNTTIIFWRAAKQVCPKIWRNPKNYVMHISQGVSGLSRLMHHLFKDFFKDDVVWNINNVSNALKKSSILTTPKDWEKGGKISKRGGNYKQLQQLADDIYLQIRKNL